MMLLPSLTNWEKTAHSLHQATQLLGAIRMFLFEPMPNFLELPMQIKSYGLSTGLLPGGGEIRLDFQQIALIYQPASGDSTAILLAGHSQASLFEALLSVLTAGGQVLVPKTADHPSFVDAFYAALVARGHQLIPPRAELTRDTPLEVVPQLAADYAQVLHRIFTATARFRARLVGPMTPIVVWSEHFDLSFLWFATAQATERNPHMNFGFAPYSEGLPRPYLYSYAYPLPSGLGAPNLPSPARWHTAGWTGVVVPYDELVTLNDPEAVIEETFGEIYKVLSSILI